MSGHAVAVQGLSKRFGAVWALRDCDLAIPEGRIVALIGPNGAGKTTLLHLLAGLSRPSSGSIAIFGEQPRQDPRFLAQVGFLAQEAPLYRRLDAQTHLEIGARLNARFDSAMARDRLTRLSIPLDRPVRTLSGGQRAQVALALAIAKRPRLLLLDEPVAALDPLARREFLASLAEGVAEGGATVILSSHLLLDLERICDHLVLLTGARVQLCGDIEPLLAEHVALTAPRRATASLQRAHDVIDLVQTPRQTRALARLSGPVLDPDWEASSVSLEELVLAYMSRATGLDARPLAAVGSVS